VDTERAAMKPTVAKILRAEVIILVSPVETSKLTLTLGLQCD
jgi:hypothetical protein